MTTVETTEAERDSQIEGVAAAALFAAGIGAFVLGLLTTLNEASASVHDFLEFDTGVGPLSGKTVLAGAAYFAALIVLALVWRGRRMALRSVLIGSIVLLVLGFIGTFPEFFEAFAD
jgi:hypothetical protein